MNHILIARLFVASFILITFSVTAQEPEGDRLTAKSLEAAIAFSQTRSQWCFVIIGGTVVVLLQESFRRPAKRYARWSYLCFLPAWVFFAVSIYSGTKTQRVYLAYLLNSVTTLPLAREKLNAYMSCQIWSMEAGLCFLALWLLVLLKWWLLDY